MTGAGLFLDVVTIMSGVLMLCVAVAILINKFPDIVDEILILLGKRQVKNSPEQQGQEEKTQGEQDVEAGETTQPNNQSTPSKDYDIAIVATMNSPDSLEMENAAGNEYHLSTNNNEMDEDNYISKYLDHDTGLHLTASPSDNSYSLADSCSVYLDASYNYPDSQASPTQTALKQSRLNKADTNDNCSPFSKAKIHLACNDDVDTDLDYSMETVDHNNQTKESFSSYAKPNLTMMTGSILDDTTCVDDHKLSFNLFSKYNTSTVVSSHSEEPRTEDSSSEPTSKDSFSPLARRNVTFSSQLLDDTATGLDCSRDLVMKQIIASVTPSPPTCSSKGMNKALMNCSSDDLDVKQSQDYTMASSTVRATRRPKITVVTNKSILNLGSTSSSEEDDDEDDDVDLNTMPPPVSKEIIQFTVPPSVVREITPSTVTTVGLWSPLSEASTGPQPSDESFDCNERDENGSSVSYDDSEEAELPDINNTSMESCDSQCFHNVHVCKSEACRACRHPQQSAPTFLSTSTGLGKDCSLPRPLPRRWWDQQQDYDDLKQYVSSVLLSKPGEGNQLDQEEHPFDEM